MLHGEFEIDHTTLLVDDNHRENEHDSPCEHAAVAVPSDSPVGDLTVRVLVALGQAAGRAVCMTEPARRYLATSPGVSTS